MRPKPQLSQQQTVETKVVTRMALFLSLATEAMAPRKRLQILAEAMAEPKTSTRAICMEKDSRPQKPFELPQASTSSRGVCFVPIMDPTKVTMVRMTANRKASGSHRLTTRTQPFVNFLNIQFLLIFPIETGAPQPRRQLQLQSYGKEVRCQHGWGKLGGNLTRELMESLLERGISFPAAGAGLCFALVSGIIMELISYSYTERTSLL